MMAWTCPFCQRPTTMTEADFGSQRFDLKHLHKDFNLTDRKTVFLDLIALKCPNPDCNETELRVKMYKARYNQYLELITSSFSVVKNWELAPEANIKKFPNYIPN